MNRDQLIEKYLNTVTFNRLLEKKEERLLVLLSVLRFITFIGGLILAWEAFMKSILLGIILIIIFSVLFLFLLKLFGYHSDKKEFFNNLSIINHNEAEAVSGNLSAFETGNMYSDTRHDYSFDVDLFGPSSLFQYLNRTVTGYGRDILANWLSDPFRFSNELVSRQETIKELALKDRWRQEFMASGMKAPLEKEKISGLLDWLDESSGINSSLFNKFLIFFLPALAIASLLLLIAGILPYPVFIFIFLLNLFYIATALKKINKVHNALSKRYNFLSSVNGLLKTFEYESFNSFVLNDIKSNISGKNASAAVSVKKLGRLIQTFDSRNNQLLGIILNGLLLWDFQSIRRLEKWKSCYKSLFPLWLEMVGQVDAYISLGNYAFNNSEFAYPHISKDGSLFSATKLGHQLINERKRVCNDFSIGKSGTICVISGANMAGKSTFLRTIAVNYILGMTGAPVCASEMEFIPRKLFTSMRTMDSLSDNESYFYAELRRLNILKSKIEEGEPVFFILDEILKGTNSEDKSTGSKLFLQKIITKGGTGLIATHDTSLGKLESD